MARCLLGESLHKSCVTGKSARAFTLVELLVVIAVIGILAALLLPVLGKSKNSALRANCLNNLHQVTVLLTMYADSNNERFPQLSSGHWAWDIPKSISDAIADQTVSPLIFFCPANGFTKDDFLAQWNEFVSIPPTTNDYRVVGYAMTFPGTASLLSSNQNASILPQVIVDTNTSISYPPPLASERILSADATISRPGEANVVDRSLNSYVNIKGAYAKPHRSAYVKGNYPSGGNLGMLDGHVEWRPFHDMFPRSDATLRA